jgi:hypothetical protein
VRVAQRRCALYGLLIYRQGDIAGFFFSYDFYRNKVVLLPEVKDPRYRDIRELKVPVVVYVEVVYLTDGAASGVEDVFLAEFVVRGCGCWWCASRVRFMGLSSLPFGGEERPLTTLLQRRG